VGMYSKEKTFNDGNVGLKEKSNNTEKKHVASLNGDFAALHIAEL
jgi:hypothetical protein